MINRLQVGQGGVPFNNLLDDCRGDNTGVRVDFAALAAAQGCASETVATVSQLEDAMHRARASNRTYVIALATHPDAWTEGGTSWEVGVPGISSRSEVIAARAAIVTGKSGQRRA